MCRVMVDGDGDKKFNLWGRVKGEPKEEIEKFLIIKLEKL